jgi:hypothetical protein
VDFDGVLHEHAGYRARFGNVDVELIHALHRAGYPVAVSTCNDIPRVAKALRAEGIVCWEDRYGRTLFWGGGEAGTTVLVTGGKVAAWKYIDDHNAGDAWHYGMDVAEAVRQCQFPAPARCGRCGAQAHYVSSLARPASREIILGHNDGCDVKLDAHIERTKAQQQVRDGLVHEIKFTADDEARIRARQQKHDDETLEELHMPPPDSRICELGHRNCQVAWHFEENAWDRRLEEMDRERDDFWFARAEHYRKQDEEEAI